jgi:hypothetical protein
LVVAAAPDDAAAAAAVALVAAALGSGWSSFTTVDSLPLLLLLSSVDMLHVLLVAEKIYRRSVALGKSSHKISEIKNLLLSILFNDISKE